MKKRIFSVLLFVILCMSRLPDGVWIAESEGLPSDRIVEAAADMEEKETAEIQLTAGMDESGVAEIEEDITPMIFVTGVIPADIFEIKGLPGDVDTDMFLAGWSYTADGKPINQVPIRPDGTTPASRFPEYPGYHFVNVTIDNVEATQLGILKLSEFLGVRGEKYYYLTHTSGNEHETSSTILEEGQKFTINYAFDEFEISYEVRSADDKELPGDVTLDSIFGTGRSAATVNRAYSFDVRIPYGYTAHVYRYWTDENGTKQHVELMPEHNGGYPLGTEPVYVQVNSTNIKADESQGPKSMLVNDTFYEDNVTQNRHIVVELTKNAAPVFDAGKWLHTEYAGGYQGSSNHRGTTAPEDFNWEEYYSQGNKADIEPEGGWNWGSLYDELKAMTGDEDGTYSYTWTFQTNSVQGDGYFLDTLEVNGFDLVIPFYPRVTDPDGDLLGFDQNSVGIGEVEGKSYTVMTLPDGAKLRLDYLYVFHGGNPCNQRVYRLTVTGAVCNVTVTGGNLMMYTSGAPEFVTYSLKGVHADEDVPPDNRAKQHPAIQAYWGDDKGWRDHPMSNVVVDFPYTGDDEHGGATIRFKLADGYSNPYYSFESTRDGIINGTDGEPQASIVRGESGNIVQQNAVLPLGSIMDSRHIYGPDADGWYYIKVTRQGEFESSGSGNDDSYKIALLSIVATPVKYVIRYLPGEVTKPEPDTMPEFEHSAPEWSGIENSEQYNDNGGSYYNIETDNVITVDGSVPVDSEQQSTITGKIFRYWTLAGNEKEENGTYKVLDDNIRIYPGQALTMDAFGNRLTNLIDDEFSPGYSVLDTDLLAAGIDVRVLQFQAVWASTPDPFAYTIWIEYVDEEGNRHREEVPADVVNTEIDYGAGEKLIVGVNLDSPVFADWLKTHPYYHFDPQNNKDVHVIDNDGEIVITFVRTNGALVLEKHVEGDPGSIDTFTFTIDAKDDLNENFLAWPADIQEDDRTESDMIVVHFDYGKAKLELKDGQSVIIYIPEGEYVITEENIEDADYRVNIDGEDVANGEPARTIRAAVFEKNIAPVIFTNRFGMPPESGSNSEQETDPESETGPESGTDRIPETDPESETNPESGAAPEPGTDHESGTDSKPETNPTPDGNPEPGGNPEPETTSGSGNNMNNPQDGPDTSDTSNITLWVSLMCISGLTIAYIIRKKYNN